MTGPYHNIPYPTEAERIEARRKTWRESRQRRMDHKKATREQRTAKINAMLDEMIHSGMGPASRRMDIMAILDRGRR